MFLEGRLRCCLGDHALAVALNLHGRQLQKEYKGLVPRASSGAVGNRQNEKMKKISSGGDSGV